MPPKTPQPGIWCPAITFFNPSTDTLDLPSQSAYFTYLSRTGLRGLVILGTNAETFLLTRPERRSLVACARAAVGQDFPLMVGCSGHSTAQVLEYIGDAVAEGADYALVLPPGYFGAKASDVEVVVRFYEEVAAKSEVPVVVYNFPGVCGGVDLDSEVIARIARLGGGGGCGGKGASSSSSTTTTTDDDTASATTSNVVGVKLTCGSVAKITRLTAEFGPAEHHHHNAENNNNNNNNNNSSFAVFGGQSDFLIGGLSVGSAGCIAAFANVFPKTLVKIYDLYTSATKASSSRSNNNNKDNDDDQDDDPETKKANLALALALHRKAALAESPCKAGIAHTKYAAAIHTARWAGIEGAVEKLRPRRPYGPPDEAAKEVIRRRMEEVAEIEEGIPMKG